MEENKIMYINKCRSYIRLMLALQQWSGINKQDIDRWLANFKDIEQKDIYLVYKLLTNIIYFCEQDVIDILSYGLDNHLYGDIVLTKQIEADFQLSSKAILNIVKENSSKTCFMPLLYSNSPHESANYITRLMTQQGLIETHQTIFLNQFVEAFEKYEFNRLVIVDDCLGSGDQLRRFWYKNAYIDFKQKRIHIKEYCSERSVKIDYLVLFGYDESIKCLDNEFKDLNIHCIKKLSDTQRVFTNESYIWDNEEERGKAFSFFKGITEICGVQLFGYGNLDFAFIMHKTIPDWSLPLFWRKTPDWDFLLRRKDSDD